MSPAPLDARTLAEVIDRDLRARGSSTRAVKQSAYLKSELVHYGVSIPDTRTIVRAALGTTDLDHDGVITLAEMLWDSVGDLDLASRNSSQPKSRAGEIPVYERRAAATMVLIQSKDHLGAGDAGFFERLLRQARTWALVDPLAGDVIGPLTEHDQGFDAVLERWAVDEDFWIRRSALLAHLRPLREGRGDFDRFARFADSMLEEKEFFIRKAIGWVLRDTARKRPEMVYEWIQPRVHRASGVTMREAVKHLSAEQREALLAAK